MNGGNPNIYAQSFTATQSGTVSTIDVGVVRPSDSTATDGVRVGIQADSSGVPSLVNLGYVDLADGSLTSSCAAYTGLTLSSSVSVTNGVTYWLVYQRQGALAAYPSRYDTCGESPQGYQNSKWYDGSSWTVGNVSLYGKIYIVSSGGSSASATSTYDTLNAWNSIYFGLCVSFALSFFSTIYIWRRLV